MVFPTTNLDFKCEMAFGIDPNGVGFINPPAWSDVTQYFLDQQISITRGRSNETDEAQVMAMNFELDNNTGIFTPDNPESALYPFVRRGVIMRYGIYGGDSYLSYKNSINDTAVACSTPDNAALDVVGDIEIAMEIQPYAITGLTPLVTKYVSAGNQRSFFLSAQPDPNFPTNYRLVFEWSTDGSVSGAQAIVTEYVFTYHNRVNFKFTLDVNNGAGGFTGTWAIARKWGEDWYDLSYTIGVGTTSIFNSTAPVEIMANSSFTATTDNFLGKVYRAQIRNGIGGTLVANPDFRALARGVGSFNDSAGRVWTIGPGAEITNLHERFFGNVDSWNVSWPNGDATGTVAPESRVNCQASSIRRRMGQGDKPLQSPMRRFITDFDNLLVGYWPFEDEDGSTQVANGIPNQPAGVVDPLQVEFASSSDQPAGTQPLAVMGSAFTFTGDVQTYISGSPLNWSVSSFMKIPLDVTVPTILMTVWLVPGGTIARMEFSLDSTTQYRIRSYNSIGGIIDEAVGSHSDLYVGQWGQWIFNATQSGANVVYSLQWYKDDNYTQIPNFGGASTFAATLTNVDYINIPAGIQMAGSSIGHVWVMVSAGTIYTDAAGGHAVPGYPGETAVRRFNRLCAEQTIASSYGTMPLEHSTAMGPQEIDGLLSIFAQLAISSNSVFLDGRFFRGLKFINLYDMLDISVQMALDAAQEHITNPLSPTLDDQFLRNSIESSRPGGSTNRQQDDLSVLREGEYLDQVTVNVQSDTQLADDASWRLHLGTQPELAFPPITVELSKTQAVANALIPVWLSDYTDVGCLITLANLPRQADSTLKYFLLQGYTETISPQKWTLQLNCTPYKPYMITWFDNDYVALKLAPAVTTLDVGINTSVGSFVANLNGGDSWTTDPLDMPILIEMAGEHMNVTAISAVASGKQTLTVTRSVNGVVKSHVAGEGVNLAYPAYLSLV